MDSNIIYFSNCDFPPKEGGMARNYAFYQEMKKRGARIYNYSSSNMFFRAVLIIRNIFLLVSFRKKKVVVLQSFLLKYIFPYLLFKYSLCRKVIQMILNRITRNNRLFLEVNDLIFEQSTDLGMNVSGSYLTYQEFIFKQNNLHFIFASQLMAEYVEKKYGINPEQYQTVINGAPLLHNSSKKEIFTKEETRLKCIYAGTLNKGREINNFLSIFINNPEVLLVIIGTDGEWLKELSKENIRYLGAYDEREALQIAAQCDIGIVPYNEDKLYYNICYPTKNSFYMAAGLPILSTPLLETMRVFNQYPEIAFFIPIKEWNFFLNKMTTDEVIRLKKIVQQVQVNFSWDYLLDKMDLN